MLFCYHARFYHLKISCFCFCFVCVCTLSLANCPPLTTLFFFFFFFFLLPHKFPLVVQHDNLWVVENLSTDAIIGCELSSEFENMTNSRGGDRIIRDFVRPRTRQLIVAYWTMFACQGSVIATAQKFLKKSFMREEYLYNYPPLPPNDFLHQALPLDSWW